MKHPDLPIKKTLKRVFVLLNVMNLKICWNFFQSNIYSMQGEKWKRVGKFFDGIQSTEDYPPILR